MGKPKGPRPAPSAARPGVGRNVFTPYANLRTNRRVRLWVSDTDHARIRRDRWGPFEFTDVDTGAVFEVRGASCGSDACFCAAEILRTVKPSPLQHEYVD